jgi:hypothetical protein
MTFKEGSNSGGPPDCLIGACATIATRCYGWERVCLEQAEASSLLDAKAAFHHMANRYRTRVG